MDNLLDQNQHHKNQSISSSMHSTRRHVRKHVETMFPLPKAKERGSRRTTFNVCRQLSIRVALRVCIYKQTTDKKQVIDRSRIESN